MPRADDDETVLDDWWEDDFLYLDDPVLREIDATWLDDFPTEDDDDGSDD